MNCFSSLKAALQAALLHCHSRGRPINPAIDKINRGRERYSISSNRHGACQTKYKLPVTKPVITSNPSLVERRLPCSSAHFSILSLLSLFFCLYARRNKAVQGPLTVLCVNMRVCLFVPVSTAKCSSLSKPPLFPLPAPPTPLPLLSPTTLPLPGPSPPAPHSLTR